MKWLFYFGKKLLLESILLLSYCIQELSFGKSLKPIQDDLRNVRISSN